MNHVEGQVVWITGATSGIGEALAGKYASLGSRLIVSGRNMGKLHKLRESLPARCRPAYQAGRSRRDRRGWR